MKKLRVILLKPSKYRVDGYVERFTSGFMPNATLSHIASMTPDTLGQHEVEIEYIDEYIRPETEYLKLLKKSRDALTLLAIVGTQSHQFHRAIDLAAFAKSRGVENVIIGGPHPMTCDTTMLHDRGISFSISEAELVWQNVLQDSIDGELQPIYGTERRWAPEIEGVKFRTPPPEEVKRHWVPMVGLYPVRGCPYSCNFCSVIKIAGRNVRHPSIDSIIASLRDVKRAGIELVVFTSDNFNKFPAANDLLNGIIDENLGIKFFYQADTQIANQPSLIELIGRAGGVEMFLGAESFDNETLKDVQKRHNKPATYGKIVEMSRDAGIRTHFSNIIGFPDQNEQGVKRHLDQLIELSPELASFYVLTPIPGTDQYQDFRDRNLIFETNLDRFDTTTPTFTHEYLSPEVLQKLLFDSYEIFYKHSMHAHKNRVDRTVRNFMAFCRWSASRKIHPMSGGSGHVMLDKNLEYQIYRTKVFGIGENLPLPDNLKLSQFDQQMNREADWKIRVAN